MHALRIIVSALVPALAFAQPSVPLRTLVAEVRIEGRLLTAKTLWPTGIVAIGSDGRFLVTPSNANSGINAFEADGKTSQFNVPTGWRDFDIVWPRAIGRFGKDYWIADQYGHQVAFVSPDAKIVGGIAHPSWIHPKWAERRAFPVFGDMVVQAVYPDSQLLVRPVGARTLLDTPGFDRTLTHLLRINKDGQIQREIAVIDDRGWKIEMRAPNQQAMHVAMVPFATRPAWSVADDGARVAVVLPAVTTADSGSYRVISIGANGDTVFNRRYPGPVVPVAAAQADSALKSVNAYGTRSAEDIRAQLRKLIPKYRSFVTGVIAGYDQTTWVITRPTVDSSQAREALILDPRGEPIGRVELPRGFTAQHADRDHVWGIDKAKPAIVRFKVEGK